MDDEKELICKLRCGSIRSYEVLYNTYYKGLCCFSSRFVEFDDAEEIVQETMMWLWENKQMISPDYSLKSLLFMIVKNKSLNRIREYNMKHKAYYSIIEKIEEEYNDPDYYAASELEKAYKNCVNNLPKNYRDAYLMNREDNLTHKEISQILHVSNQTVNYRICQALRILRMSLKEFHGMFF